ncbi:kinase-like domain-containing protein [Rhizophagus irregularis DAOM 181602=DAOM 197198]|nr:kinase-like domain-containing protein [Rhizophagus irregularis DAOM 181602=DAOM 197198]
MPIRQESIISAVDRANDILNFNIHNTIIQCGCSEIYTANWIGGSYNEWDSNKRKLKRFGTHKVILKTLENIENANRSWFDEAKSHLTISNKWSNIVKCYGLTQDIKDIKDKKYMLVMYAMSMDLRSYLQENHDKLTWEERIVIIYDIIIALYRIHKENTIHRDLHSGNMLYLKSENIWCISDLGFCGPAEIPLKSIYGNLSYVAPENINIRQSFKSRKKTVSKINKSESRIYLSDYLPHAMEDDDALYHISNLHPEEQDELEIPDDIF